jgi:hypothetical protein
MRDGPAILPPDHMATQCQHGHSGAQKAVNRLLGPHATGSFSLSDVLSTIGIPVS